MLPIEGPSFEAVLPFAWHAGQFKPTATEWEIIRYLMVLADFEQAPITIELSQAKQDLLLLWLAKHQSITLPNQQNILMGLSRISWLDAAPASIGMTGAVQFAFSATFPFLLQLEAEIISCEPEFGEHRIVAQMINLSPAVQDQIEQTIFRYHRRAIQNAKHANS